MAENGNGPDRRNAQLPAVTSPAAPGSLPLRHRVHERYCRYRAEGLPRDLAYKRASYYAWKSGRKNVTLRSSTISAINLEKRPQITERIQYLTNDVASVIASKRARLEETLWSIHEADIGECFETYDKTEKIGDTVTTYKANRPKLLDDLPPEIRRNIEKINIDGRGRLVPQLYSKLAASQELRKMLDIGRPDERSEIQRLSDADLLSTLSDQAKQLGLNIDLNYSFAAPVEPPEEDKDAG